MKKAILKVLMESTIVRRYNCDIKQILSQLADEIIKEIEKPKPNLSESIKYIAENYHDRPVMGYTSIFGGKSKLKCECCEKGDCITIQSLEHDGKNKLEDISICTFCYTSIFDYWVKNKLKKSICLM